GVGSRFAYIACPLRPGTDRCALLLLRLERARVRGPSRLRRGAARTLAGRSPLRHVVSDPRRSARALESRMASASPDLLAQHTLTPEEYERIRKALGRDPNLTELGLFSVMWSEHCSYKSSRIHLKTLPTQGPRVLQGPGENAGAVDIGDGLAAVFKIESHN